MDQFVEGDRGYGFGLVRTVYVIVAASGSPVVGSLADVGGWLLGYGVVVLLLATTLVALSANRALSLNL
jgi:MFS family permease